MRRNGSDWKGRGRDRNNVHVFTTLVWNFQEITNRLISQSVNHDFGDTCH